MNSMSKSLYFSNIFIKDLIRLILNLCYTGNNYYLERGNSIADNQFKIQRKAN